MRQKALQYSFVEIGGKPLQQFEILKQDKPNGDGVIMKYRTRRGTDIYCLGVPLYYDSGGDWDLGPSWCYIVKGEKLTLIDTGQFDKFDLLTTMLDQAGLAIRDIERVIVTHGHEDHDGNLPEVLEASGAELWAHYAFDNMIAYHEDIDDGAAHPEFPGSCRTCLMPEKFNAVCRPYHRKRSLLKTTHRVKEGDPSPDSRFRFLLTPGHSPDSLCAIFEEEVVFGGDTLLATITPHPSLMLEYYCNKRILPGGYGGDNGAYGLIAYIKSLDKLQNQCRDTELLLPGHRLYEKGRPNYLKPAERAAEILRFHIERCGNILRILDGRVLDLDQIAIELFEPRLRKGLGKYLSQREVMSHLELMAVHGDIAWADVSTFTSRSTGSENYKDFFREFTDKT
jgi:glyoxylase-like metal-dependent hydrolase (beta-lactamase superfamily II)